MAMRDAIPKGETLTLLQAAKMLGVKPGTVRNWITNKELDAFNAAEPGKKPRWKIKREDLDAFMAKRQPEKKPKKKPKPK